MGGQVLTGLSERYKRMTGEVEEAVPQMYLSVGKDTVSRIARRLEEERRTWRERPFEEEIYPYLYLDATYLKVHWGAGVASTALPLACVMVHE